MVLHGGVVGKGYVYYCPLEFNRKRNIAEREETTEQTLELSQD